MAEDNAVKLGYDLKGNTCTVSITFTPDAVLSLPEKAHLETNVVVNHLLMQAAAHCQMAAANALKPNAVDTIAAEQAQRQAELDAEFAKKRAALPTVHDIATVVASNDKAMAAIELAAAAAEEEANRDLKVAAEAKRLADEATAAAIAELTTPMEVVP